MKTGDGSNATIRAFSTVPASDTSNSTSNPIPTGVVELPISINLRIDDTNPDLLDAGQLTGLERIRRYRHTPPWPVFRFGRYVEHDSATPETSSTPRVLHQWCRGTMPDVHRVESNHEISFELGDGALGRLGECSLYCGAIHRADVPRYATANDETGSTSLRGRIVSLARG